MGVYASFHINASGMTAQRYRMDVIAENVANANTTRTKDGTPYRRKDVTFQEKQNPIAAFDSVLYHAKGKYNRFVGSGVKVGGYYEDHSTDLTMVYDPSHPDADENGCVYYPNVEIVTEMTNLIDASRAYEANATAFNTTKQIALSGLEVGQGGA